MQFYLCVTESDLVLEVDMSAAKKEKQLTSDELLRKSRNSVNISFALMLTYVDNVLESKSIPDGDIQFLLKTYREMAKTFYSQYEKSLIEKINQHNIDNLQSDEVISYIRKLKKDDPKKKELKKIIPLLKKTRDEAAAEYNNLTSNFPTLLQNALDKLKDEWQRLNTIAVASKTLDKDDILARVLKQVVEYAAFTVEIEAERIAIVPGDAFALYFFTYLENFAVLTVPIYSVQAPWEWSIFWHELAGYKVRQIKKGTTLTTSAEELKHLYDLYKDPDKLADIFSDPSFENTPQEQMLGLITMGNEFSQTYLKGLFDGNTLNLSDLGDFEHQFNRMLENISSENAFQQYEQIKADGWCVDWYEELFEDAWSVLTFREDFLTYFQDILSRHDTNDGRHPPLKVRLSVAKELLKLKDAKGTVENQPKPIETMAANQILKFMSLIISAKFYKLLELLEGDQYKESYKGELIVMAFGRMVGLAHLAESINSAVSEWSENLVPADDSASNVKQDIENTLSKFEGQIFPPILKKELVSSFEDLLKGKDYKQLLDLSFFERDFFNANTIQHVYYRKTVTDGYKEKKFTKPLPFSISFDPITELGTFEKEIKITVGPNTFYMQRDNWNTKFDPPSGPHSIYHIDK